MVSYKEVKEKITIEQVLKKYGVQYSKRGKQLVATCPSFRGCFHQTSGADTSRSVHRTTTAEIINRFSF